MSGVLRRVAMQLNYQLVFWKNDSTMVFWLLQRLFSTCTLILYVIALIWLDFTAVTALVVEPLTWTLIFVQGFRHACLGMTLGYHRYFSHSAFKASRLFELVLSYSCAASNQGAMSWWAANHRHHHGHCDTAEDPHSPVARSLPYAWFGWTYDLRNAHRKTRLNYPETLWLDKYCFLVPWLEWLLIGWVSGSRAFATMVSLLPAALSPIGTLFFNVAAHAGEPDENGCHAGTYRNFSAYILGEHMHKDHHDFPTKAIRPGPDIPYRLVLRPMEKLGLARDLRRR